MHGLGRRILREREQMTCGAVQMRPDGTTYPPEKDPRWNWNLALYGMQAWGRGIYMQR